MPVVLLTETAQANLRRLVEIHSLPSSTSERVANRLSPLADFPAMGAPLAGAWAGARFLVGPWAWMLIVYEHDEVRDLVVVLTIQDGRRVDAVTSG